MNSRFNHNHYNIILLILCVVCRISTTIYYIEDIDSLRFALSIKDYDITKFQPHFPGYPVFCFIVKGLFLITNSMAVSFSIIGGAATFMIIFSILKISRVEINSFSGIFFSIVIFFNPLLWLMGNRYMPDLMGLAVALFSFYLLTAENNKINFILLGALLVGILAGTRLSYIPLLCLPLLTVLLENEKRLKIFFAFFIGNFVWLFPLVSITGIQELYAAAGKQTIGHFSDFGGTVITENNWYLRFISLIKSIWADGLGGYWIGRSWQTVLLSLPLIYLIYNGTLTYKKHFNKNKILRTLFYSILIYVGWIFFFQNIIYKSRHILPVLSFLLLIIGLGQKYVYKERLITKFLVYVPLVFLISVTLYLVEQHRSPTAVSKLKDYIINNEKDKVIISTPLINYYLKTNGIASTYISVYEPEKFKSIPDDSDKEIIMIGDFNELVLDNYKVSLDSIFYHNPYVNNMWSKIKIYTLKENENG